VAVIANLNSPEFGALLAADEPLAVLVPMGSVEPHGPHLPLGTDTTISLAASEGAIEQLAQDGISAALAPPIPYGVTECAAAFPGAVSIPAEALTTYARAVVEAFLAAGVDHVCLVNNHLEPAHDTAIRGAIAGLPAERASVACPLTRRWARTLSVEFKKGECHAGRYETSIVMAKTPELVDENARAALPEVPVSLSDQLRAGVTDFAQMGMSDAYAGAPADATAEEGRELVALLATMIRTEIVEGLRGSG